MDSIHYKPKALILRMGKVPFMDSTGIANFTNIVRHFNKQGGTIIVTGVKPQVQEILVTTGLYEEIGDKNFFPHTGEAINYAISVINFNKCIGCKHFAFHECQMLSTGVRQDKLVSQDVTYNID